MSGYAEEHNLPNRAEKPKPYRRPDLSSLFSHIDSTIPSSNNQNTLPTPGNTSTAYRQLAQAYQIMLGEHTGVSLDLSHTTTPDLESAFALAEGNPLLQQLIPQLQSLADSPPERVESVSDEYLANLERVPKKALKKDMSCPICSVPFLEDEYPLVVRLPCHRDHIFDLACIEPWLKLNVTCPMDRKRLVKEKEPIKKDLKENGEEEEEWDDMYG